MTTATTKQLVIYGAGGFGREVAWLAEACHSVSGRLEPVCFASDDERRPADLNGLPVLSLDEARDRFPGSSVCVAVGSPASRERMTGRAKEMGFGLAMLIHPGVERSRWIELGEGVVICAGTILTTNIKIGHGVQINLGCTIGHDVVLGDYATLAPGVHVSGCVRVGAGAYLGTGAVIINGRIGEPLVIGARSVVGAAACVVGDVPAGVTVVGVPARPRGSPA